MFANGQYLFVLATFLVANVYAQKNEIVGLDDVVGLNYVDSKEVRAAKMNMLSRGNGYGTDWIVMPDGNGNPEIAILSMNGEDNKSSLDRSFFTETMPPEEAVTFRLYTRNNMNGEDFDRSNMDSVDLDVKKPIKIIIHGWRSSSESLTVRSIRDGYLETSDMNVITVDWSEPARNIFYPAPAMYTKKVGRYLGSMIDDLVSRKGASYDNFHLIGHSLGAHTAGIAGFSSQGDIARITGLDPALPGFQNLSFVEDKLDATDGQFVDVIHTCAGALGMSAPIGHADFYPNGGTPFQPGCCCLTEMTGVCSHGRSHEYFSESIYNKEAFKGIKCNSWRQFLHNECENFIVPMGEYTPKSTRGIFYLETDSSSPFGLGSEGTKCTHPK